MPSRVLVFGASGNLGKEILRHAVKEGYDVTAVVRSEQKQKEIQAITAKSVVSALLDAPSLDNLMQKTDVVISALGKSVSPNDRSPDGFYAVDWEINARLIDAAIKANVRKFVYVSAFHSERYRHLAYFDAHFKVEEKLRASKLDYSILKPPAIFSAFLDMIPMAKKGQLANLGAGNHKTNPIFEGDLAKLVVQSILKSRYTLEAGGGDVFTRAQLAALVQQTVAPGRKVRNIPVLFLRVMLPIIKLTDRNLYDKFAFFLEVSAVDTLAPKMGTASFEDYIRAKAARMG